MLMRQEDKDILRKYLPESAVDMVADAIVRNKIAFKITKARRTKLGDFRAGPKGTQTRISINHNLNPYNFLLTFVHELAHHYVWQQYGRKVLPHGDEWKRFYKELMQPYLDAGIFPDEIRETIAASVIRGHATDGADVALARGLRTFDENKGVTDEVELTKLLDGSYFKIANGRVFQKLHVQRKRYKCVCLSSKRLYLFSPIAGVKPLLDDEINNLMNHINLKKK